MFIKSIVLGSLLTGIFATPMFAYTPHFKSGFLAGAHVGIANNTGSYRGIFFTNDATGETSLLSSRTRKTSALLGVFGGYRHVFPEGYTFGVDVSLNFLTHNELSVQFSHFNEFNFKNSLSRQYNITPSINFGKIMCDRFHVYLGLGLAITRFKLRVEDIGDNPASFKASQTLLGFVPAIGVEYSLTHNVSVFGNVSYEVYQNMKKTFNVSSSTMLPGSTYTSAIRPQYLILKIGGAYRF